MSTYKLPVELVDALRVETMKDSVYRQYSQQFDYLLTFMTGDSSDMIKLYKSRTKPGPYLVSTLDPIVKYMTGGNYKTLNEFYLASGTDYELNYYLRGSNHQSYNSLTYKQFNSCLLFVFEKSCGFDLDTLAELLIEHDVEYSVQTLGDFTFMYMTNELVYSQ